MPIYETSITPAQSLRELKNQHVLVECAIALLSSADNIPDVRKAKTLLDNWSMEFERLADELSPLLCLPLIDPNTTLQTYSPINQLGIVEQQKLLESRFP